MQPALIEVSLSASVPKCWQSGCSSAEEKKDRTERCTGQWRNFRAPLYPVSATLRRKRKGRNGGA